MLKKKTKIEIQHLTVNSTDRRWYKYYVIYYIYIYIYTYSKSMYTAMRLLKSVIHTCTRITNTYYNVVPIIVLFSANNFISAKYVYTI